MELFTNGNISIGHYQECVMPIEKQAYPVKVQVWAAVSAKGIIGPYFFHKKSKSVNVNQITYQECISWFMKELKASRQYRSALLMQDGATPHTAFSTRGFLNKHFPHKIIGNDFDMPWPSRSPDLTPADFYLWPTLKQSLYTKAANFKSVASLKRAITYQMRKLSQQNLGFLTGTILNRWKKCVECGGKRL